jgi:hypothetical protein
LPATEDMNLSGLRAGAKPRSTDHPGRR